MSSGSSSRYQSKLFNFVHQQSRRLTAQWEHTVRHVQVATQWGIELLLYPVYLILHSSQSTAKQLHTKEPQSRLQLEPETPPTTDTPIQQVLETVQNLPSEVSTDSPLTTSTRFHPLTFLGDLWQKLSHHRPSNDSSLSASSMIAQEQAGNLQTAQTENSLKLNHLVVQGIASSLVNRHLVLVTPDNAILDILTPQQQAHLEDKIMSAIADYWRALRLFKVKPTTPNLPQASSTRLTSGNSEQVHALPTRDTIQSKPTTLLAFLDSLMAKLESNAVIPVQQHSHEIIEVVQTQFNIFLYGKEELAARGQIAVTNDGLESHTLNLQELIAAALNYFFGVRTDKNLESRDFHKKASGKRLFQRNSQALPKNKRSQHEDLAPDPWLSWSDLFGESKKPDEKPVTSPETKQLIVISSASAPEYLPNNLTGSKQKLLQSTQPGSSLVQKKKTTRNLAPKRKGSKALATTKSSKSQSQKGEITQQQHQSNQMETQPDWIDVEAIHISYDKHILEQILELLDSAMLWLEELVVKIFQLLQRLWRGK